MEKVHGQVKVMMPAKALVKDVFANRKAFHDSGNFIMFKEHCPWREHLLKIEVEEGQEGAVKFAFFQDMRGMWRIQAIPQKSGSFENRISICEAYRGTRDDELNQKAGITDGAFVHAAGFIGGAWSLESCIKMG